MPKLTTTCCALWLAACAPLDRFPATGRDAKATWQVVPVDIGAPTTPRGGWTIGERPNPRAELPLDVVRGRWVRFSATVDAKSRGIGLRINASSRGQRTGSLPIACDAAPTMSRCSTALWMPADVEQANVVIWADNETGEILDPRVEVATIVPGRTIGDTVDAFVERVAAAYYRTDEVDWPVLRRTISAMPAPPDDLDPTPAIAQILRSRLPGNKHVVVWPTSMTTAPAATVPLPTCDSAADGIGVVALPGLTAVTGDAPAAYARALHDCLMRADPERAWIVDLRSNTGGNMYPMIGGLAPLLPIGRLYAFANGRRETTAEIGIDSRGVSSNHEIVFAARDAGSRTARPIIVVFGGRCGSSCEQTANALAARPRTLFVGEPSAGYLTGNIVLPINADYVFLLTTGYTEDPCGRILEDNLSPDVFVHDVAGKSIEALLRTPVIHDWLAAQTVDGGPSSEEAAMARCVRSPSARH